jgi:hypothetical protein
VLSGLRRHDEGELLVALLANAVVRRRLKAVPRS